MRGTYTSNSTRFKINQLIKQINIYSDRTNQAV